MAGDEKLCSSKGSNSCKYCRNNVTTSIAKCQECASVYHTSCALRVSGLIAVGKDNLVICCSGKQLKSISTQADISNKNKGEIQLFENLLLAKEETITELREKQAVLYKTIELLEEKIACNWKVSNNNKSVPLKEQFISQQKTINNTDKSMKLISNKKPGDKNGETYGSITGRHKSMERNLEYKNLEKQQREIMNRVIYLEGESEVEKRNSCDEGEEEGFRVVQRRKNRRPFKKRLGTGRNTCEDENTGFIGVERKAWLYISRVRSHVTADMVKEYILKKPDFENELVEVQEMSQPNSRSQYKSFLVKAPLSKKDELYQPEFWPLNVGIKRFSFHLYDKYRPAGDFL